MRKKLCWILPLTFTTWIVLSVFMLKIFGSHLPVVVTNLLSLSILPFLPLLSLLQQVNLVEGSAFRVPTYGGYFVGTMVYNVLLYILGLKIKGSKS